MTATRFGWERALAATFDVPRSVRLVLLTAARYADRDGGNIRPGQTRLAAETGLSERSVRRALTWAVDAGWLLQERRGHRRGDGSAVATLYRLAVPTGVVDPERTPVDDEAWAGSQPDSRVRLTDLSTGQTRPLNRTPVAAYQPMTTTPPQPPAERGETSCDRHDRPRRGCAACAAPPPERPTWCGVCDERTRLYEDPETRQPSRCRRCHPAHTRVTT